jgi:NAD(P)-dependent dehydrogenase (short-subunit alcohol dehydrogenase family)
MSEKSLAGRKALVTGGARGIGAAIAEALTNAGASVMIGDILADLGKETAGRLAKTGAKTGFVELNVTDDAQWEKAVAATIATLGGYDILINNAGIEITSLVIDVKAEDLRRMCDVNIVGTGLGMKHAFRAMRPGGRAGAGGAIVNIASVAATIAFPAIAGYSGTKSAVDRMTRVAAMEAGKLGYGVRVRNRSEHLPRNARPRYARHPGAVEGVPDLCLDADDFHHPQGELVLSRPEQIC